MYPITQITLDNLIYIAGCPIHRNALNWISQKMFLRNVLPLCAVLLARLTAILSFVAAPLADKSSATRAHGILSDYERVVAAIVAMGKQRHFVPDIITARACHLALYCALRCHSRDPELDHPWFSRSTPTLVALDAAPVVA